jgi:hypothetical protein
MDVDPSPITSRALIRFAALGVAVSTITTASTFTDLAREFTFLRYPLLATATVVVALAGWSTGRLSRFNRTLWTHAPWWARLLWLIVIAGDLVVFASISRADVSPAAVDVLSVLETRGIAPIAAYLFLIAGLRCNVDENLSNDEPFEYHETGEQESPKKPPGREAAG